MALGGRVRAQHGAAGSASRSQTYEASDGREANTLRDRPSGPIVVITSRGAKSGKLRKNPVMRVEQDGVYAAVASKGGEPTTTRSGTTTSSPTPSSSCRTALSRTLPGPPRRGRGARGVVGALGRAVPGPYAAYQEKTDREIPVFLLERIEPTEDAAPPSDSLVGVEPP